MCYVSINNTHTRFDRWIEIGGTLKDTGSQFLPVFIPRLLAACCVLFLIGTLSFFCILGVAFAGPALSHGTHVNHAAGQIISIGPGRNFILKTVTGQQMAFLCGSNCRASLGHMQRHWKENAHTDVYYIPGPAQELVAIDVD